MAQHGEDLIDDDEEDFCITDTGSSEDAAFDEMVGALQNVLMDDGFIQLQTSFCESNCDEFEDTDENKLSYTGIFQDYCSTIEAHLEKAVKQEIPDFSLSSFGSMVSSRKDEICGDVFDLLLSLGDFSEFKDLMLDHKRTKARNLRDGSAGFDTMLQQRSLDSSTTGIQNMSLQAEDKTPIKSSTRCESKLELSP